uniref:Uncharacterized protein n=1 Tax=Toxoplasma gondii COUG TaxID=1074873 RepID=A0A2G8XWE3_TOXGO|nr:hypothetical protein TGCOUG_214115 [Toxoplasma gondii COUG]
MQLMKEAGRLYTCARRQLEERVCLAPDGARDQVSLLSTSLRPPKEETTRNKQRVKRRTKKTPDQERRRQGLESPPSARSNV